MDLTRIDTIVQFTQGSATAWNNVNVPVPVGAVVIDTVNKIMKEGDGVTLFANLPVCFDYNFSGITSGAIHPEGDNVGAIAIADDQLYSPSILKLEDILADLTARADKALIQETAITNLENNTLVLDVTQGVVDGTIVICNNGKYGAGDKTLAQLISDLIANSTVTGTGMHIADLEWYTDSGLTHKIDYQNELFENSTYWCKISGFHDTAELRAVDFGLANANSGITITNTANEESCGIIAAVYGGSGSDAFSSIAVDSNGNIFAAGSTNSEGLGSYECLIVKFDKDMTILTKKRFGGSNIEGFGCIAIDSQDNVFVCGLTFSEGNMSDTLIVKFDNNLNVVVKKKMTYTSEDSFTGIAIDGNGNVYCSGYVAFTSGQATGSAYAVKFDNNLNLLLQHVFYGSSDESFNNVAIDSDNNVIFVGHTYSEGTGSAALVVKVSSSFTLLYRRVFDGGGNERFTAVTTDSQNNIYVGGHTDTAPGYVYVIKLDKNCNTLLKKYYGSATRCDNMIIDKDGNLVLVGNITSEGTTPRGLLAKFDTSLALIEKKSFGSNSGTTILHDVVNDSNGNMIICGETSVDGAGGYDALLVKTPKSIPAGNFTGTGLTGLSINDIATLTIGTSNLTVGESTLTWSATSALTISNSTLTLGDSTLTYEKDIIVAARKTSMTKLVTTVYTSDTADQFLATAIDNSGNIFAVGLTTIAGVQKALIVKFTNQFEAVARKLFTGSYSEVFNSVIIDASNNVVCVGTFKTASGSQPEAFIVKFDNTLNTIVVQKSYGASGEDVFNDVILDPSGNILVVGYTTSEGVGSKDALIIKFDTNLNIIARKRYGGSSNDVLNSVAIDTVGNTITVGTTSSEGANTSGLIMKLDANLNIVLRKIYNSTLGTTTELYTVVIGPTNAIYVAGRVVIAAGNKGLIVKFDSNINVTIQKLYGNTNGSTEFTGIAKDSSENIVVVGKTNAEGAGNYDALVLRLSNQFVVLGRKTYGSVGTDAEIGCVIDNNDDIVMSGYSVINGSTDAVVTKLPKSLPSGIYTNKYFISLVLNDSKLILSDDTATVSNSTLTMADSALTLTDNTMVLNNATGAIKSDTTILDGTPNIFKVQIGDVVTSGDNITSTFNAVTNDGNDQVGKNIDVTIKRFGIIAAVYGGTGADQPLNCVTDIDGNVYVVGNTNSEGAGSYDGLIIKYDNNLNILAKKCISGTNEEWLYAIKIDSKGNIFVAGYTQSEGAGSYDGLIIKYDNNLNILAKKRYGGTQADILYGLCIDNNDNVFVAGFTYSEGPGIPNYQNALIIKLDNNLNIINKKYYGGAYDDYFHALTVDRDNNIYAVGGTSSEGLGSSDGLIIKFDTNLNILVAKRYGGTDKEYFYEAVIDSLGNIYIVGRTASEGAGNYDALLLKFDKNFNLLIKKRYGGSGLELFRSLKLDSKGNIVACGQTTSESGGGDTYYGDAIVVKFDKDFNILSTKRVYGPGNEGFTFVCLDNQDNIFLSGVTSSVSSGNFDYLVVKLSSTFVPGTATGTVLTGLTFSEITASSLSASNLTLADSTLTLANSALTLGVSTLIVSNSSLTAKREVINI